MNKREIIVALAMVVALAIVLAVWRATLPAADSMGALDQDAVDKDRAYMTFSNP